MSTTLFLSNEIRSWSGLQLLASCDTFNKVTHSVIWVKVDSRAGGVRTAQLQTQVRVICPCVESYLGNVYLSARVQHPTRRQGCKFKEIDVSEDVSGYNIWAITN